MKIFATQLAGLFKKIEEKNEDTFEDGARLLAQAGMGQGKIYIYGINEMAAVVAEATAGSETLPFIRAWEDSLDLMPTDRVILFSRHSNEQAAVEVAKELVNQHVPFIAVSTVINGQEDIFTLADVHIDLQVTKGLIPDEMGNRIGLPTSMAALFVYYGLKFTLEEILSDY